MDIEEEERKSVRGFNKWSKSNFSQRSCWSGDQKPRWTCVDKTILFVLSVEKLYTTKGNVKRKPS